MSLGSKYHLLNGGSINDDREESESFLNEKGLVESSPGKARTAASYTLRLLCCISVVVNCALLIVLTRRISTKDECGEPKSPYAGLKRDLQLPIIAYGHDHHLSESAWERYDTDIGSLALSDDLSSSMGLPRAQRWPWNFSKGMYFLQGHHDLHCLRMVRDSMLEHRRGSEQSQPAQHIDHCLISLRDTILCAADDTPRYQGGGYPNSGTGQVRLCRDWDKLDEWALRHSACYRGTAWNLTLDSPLDEYRDCRDGSTPWRGSELWNTPDWLVKGRLDLPRCDWLRVDTSLTDEEKARTPCFTPDEMICDSDKDLC